MKNLIGIVGAALLAGCASVSPAPSPATYENIAAEYGGTVTHSGGLSVIRSSDGGSVSRAGATIMDGTLWSVDCSVDKMTDKRRCQISSELGGAFVYFGTSSSVQSVCVFGHDFPGRTAQVRVDSNTAITTDKEGCLPASKIITQMKEGANLATRYYEWPYDYPKDSGVSLAGFNEAMQIVADIRAEE